MITTEQLRAARAALNWSQEKLSDKCELNPRTLQRMFEGCGVPRASVENLFKAQTALEKGDEHGHIEFINVVPGILFHKRNEQ